MLDAEDGPAPGQALRISLWEYAHLLLVVLEWTDPFQLDTKLKKVRIVSDTKETMRGMKRTG